MLATYQMKSSELDSRLIESIKSNFPDEEIMIDVYPVSIIHTDIPEISSPEIIARINDLKKI